MTVKNNEIVELSELIAPITYLETCTGLQCLQSLPECFHKLWHHIYLYAGIKKKKKVPHYLEIMNKLTS